MRESTRQKLLRLAHWAEANGLDLNMSRKPHFYYSIIGKPPGSDRILFMHVLALRGQRPEIQMAHNNEFDATRLLASFGL